MEESFSDIRRSREKFKLMIKHHKSKMLNKRQKSAFEVKEKSVTQERGCIKITK